MYLKQVRYEAWEALKSEGVKKEKAMRAVVESLEMIEKKLIEGKKWFSGSKEIGSLDLVHGRLPHWLNVMEEMGGMKLLTRERFPSLYEWSQNFINIQLSGQCIQARENVVEYLKSSLSNHRSLAAA